MPRATTPAMRTLSRREFWEKHIHSWQASGLSRMAYCREYTLPYHQMTYWCQRISTSKEVAPVSAPNPAHSSKFIPVKIQPTSRSSSLTVVLTNGIQIRGVDQDNVSTVSMLIQQL